MNAHPPTDPHAELPIETFDEDLAPGTPDAPPAPRTSGRRMPAKALPFILGGLLIAGLAAAYVAGLGGPEEAAPPIAPPLPEISVSPDPVPAVQDPAALTPGVPDPAIPATVSQEPPKVKEPVKAPAAAVKKPPVRAAARPGTRDPFLPGTGSTAPGAASSNSFTPAPAPTVAASSATFTPAPVVTPAPTSAPVFVPAPVVSGTPLPVPAAPRPAPSAQVTVTPQPPSPVVTVTPLPAPVPVVPAPAAPPVVTSVTITPATPGTPVKPPIGGQVTPPAAPPRNPAEAWVADMGATFGGMARSEDAAVAVINTRHGPAYVAVGDTIPGSDIEVLGRTPDGQRLKARLGTSVALIGPAPDAGDQPALTAP